jgi:hypothetical protein
MWKGGLAKIRLEPPKVSLAADGAGAETRTVAALETLRAAASGAKSATMKAYSGPPMTLGNAAAACVRLIVWCLPFGEPRGFAGC